MGRSRGEGRYWRRSFDLLFHDLEYFVPAETAAIAVRDMRELGCRNSSRYVPYTTPAGMFIIRHVKSLLGL